MSIQNIGDRLAEARKRLGIALREASEATKIRTDYLQSMETGSFDFSLPEIYKVGFLKIYARYLKLDADKLASDYLAQFGGKAAGDRPNLGGMEAPGGLTPAHGAGGRDVPADYVAARAQNQAGFGRLALFLGGAVVILVLLVLGLNRLLDSGSATNSDSAKSPSPPSTVNTTVPPPAATTPAPPATTTTTLATPPVPGTNQFVFAASGNIANLEVRQASDSKLLSTGPLAKGKTVSVASRGPAKISVTQVQFLTIQVNGGSPNSIGDGSGKLYSGPLNGFSWPP